MAITTPQSWRNLVIYEIYVRNHGRFGTFSNVSADLPRLREMGVDVVWFMPIHPIGQLNKKGTLGCPYAVQDYRQVDLQYGTQEEFRLLCQYAHALGLKVMIDVVYNHTAHDSVLANEHPAWFHQDEEGSPTTTVPAWSDIIDLNYDNPALWDYLIDSLKFWAELGVDGFRCDVAALVPLAFWERARAELAEIKPDIIWLAESVHTNFIIDRRQNGLIAHSDGELHAAFDLSYDYDIWPVWEKAVVDPTAVPLYFSLLQYQQGIYPAHTLKMRCVENHDQPRIMARAPSRAQALAWTAFQAFNEGAFLIYAGQESENRHTPSLFDEDKIKWGDYSLQGFLTRLCHLKKDVADAAKDINVNTAAPALTAHGQAENEGLYGVFNVADEDEVMPTPLPDGTYTDLLTDRAVTVRAGEMLVAETAVILRYSGQLNTAKVRQSAVLL